MRDRRAEFRPRGSPGHASTPATATTLLDRALERAKPKRTCPTTLRIRRPFKVVDQDYTEYSRRSAPRLMARRAAAGSGEGTLQIVDVHRIRQGQAAWWPKNGAVLDDVVSEDGTDAQTGLARGWVVHRRQLAGRLGHRGRAHPGPTRGTPSTTARGGSPTCAAVAEGVPDDGRRIGECLGSRAPASLRHPPGPVADPDARGSRRTDAARERTIDQARAERPGRPGSRRSAWVAVATVEGRGHQISLGGLFSVTWDRSMRNVLVRSSGVVTFTAAMPSPPANTRNISPSR